MPCPGASAAERDHTSRSTVDDVRVAGRLTPDADVAGVGGRVAQPRYVHHTDK